MNLKKFISFSLVIVMMLSLIACGKKDAEKPAGTQAGENVTPSIPVATTPVTPDTGANSKIQAYIDHLLAKTDFVNSMEKSSAQNILHHRHSDCTLKQSIIMKNGKTSRVSEFGSCNFCFKIVFNIVDTVLDNDSVVHLFTSLFCVVVDLSQYLGHKKLNFFPLPKSKEKCFLSC